MYSKITRDICLKGKNRARLASIVVSWIRISKHTELHLNIIVHWMPSQTDTDPQKNEFAFEMLEF